MGVMGLHSRLHGPRALLGCSPLFPEAEVGLPLHTHYRLLYRLVVCRHQLIHHVVFPRCLVLAVVLAYTLPQVVRQVQLYPRRWYVVVPGSLNAPLILHFLALDGGTQVMVFILSFAVQGAAGTSHPFPEWAGAYQAGYYDRCMVDS